MITIRDASPLDRMTISQMFTRAFAHDPAAAWLVPATEDRAAKMIHNYLWVFDECASGMRFTTRQCEAASLWHFSTQLDRQSASPASSSSVVKQDECCFEGRMRMMMRSLERRKPPGDYWHLELVGCEPHCQGQGFGSAVIHAGLERIGRGSVYLETSNERNVTLYSMLGFKVLDEWELPHGGPRYRSMLRSAS